MAFQYHLTPFITKTLQEVDFIVDFLSFFEISPAASANIAKGCDEERFQKYTRLLESDVANESEYSKSSFVNAQLQAEKYLMGVTGNLTIKNLQKAHEILLRRTPFEECGGRIRTSELVSGRNLQESYPTPKSNELEGMLRKFLRFLNTPHTQHPIVKPWLTYYYFDLIRPFERMNYAFGLLILRISLQKNYPSIPWFMEKFIFENWEPHVHSMTGGMFEQSFNSRIKQNLTPFVQNCLELSIKNLNWVKEMTTSAYLEENAELTTEPRKRNALNFLLERGFRLNHQHIAQLNERQQKLIEQVAVNRDVNTKMMVQTFRCDRKTIQRDFAEIMKFDLIKQEGKTKTVRYCLNFASAGNEIAPTEVEATFSYNEEDSESSIE